MEGSRLWALFFAVGAFSAGACQPAWEAEDANLTGQQPSTLRIDYLHSGDAATESFSLDELIVEGPWPGSSDQTLDRLGYGPYFFEVRDAVTHQPIYSRGFASIFGEWQTTGEARDTNLTFQESIRIPRPDAPVDLVVSKRNKSLELEEIWQVVVDPAKAGASTANPDWETWSIFESGPPSEKVDIVLLGDGYTADEMGKWHADARRMADTLFSYDPFKRRRGDFNVRAVDTPSQLSGIARPSAGLMHETPLGATYDAFGMERYILSFSTKQWRDAAALVPYEFVIIVANNEKYGGAGIYNLFSTVAADNGFAAYVLVHEFGHHFAGLGDEYYSSNVTYETDESRPEPWSPNVTANALNPKWRSMIADSTPLPTPWPKVKFEALQEETQSRRRELRARNADEAEVAALFSQEREQIAALFEEAEHGREIGAFEGANYASAGYFRPEMNCIMFTRDTAGFGRVCSSAIDRAIDRYVGRASSEAEE